jgi:hypothetical protein
LAGCGDGRPERVPVTGRVTYQGDPVTTGTIYFWPDEGPQARGTLGPDGRYRLRTFEKEDGAVLGEHRVTIEAKEVSAGGPDPKSMDEEFELFSDPDAESLGRPRLRWLVPEEYADRATSGLTAEVTPGENTIDFSLPIAP